MSSATDQPDSLESTPPGSPLRRLLRIYLEGEWLRYGLSAGTVGLIMLLVPGLLNNMLLTAAVLLLGVAILPELLRKFL